MNINAIQDALDIIRIASYIVQSMASTDHMQNKWEEISRIAAENAAKAEIQGHSEH